MSQFWHNICCRQCESGPCPDCPSDQKVSVEWTGSITFESQCCEGEDPDFPCLPHQTCAYWNLPETTIGPINFLLVPVDNNGFGDECVWEGSECFAITAERCVICDCPSEDNPQPDPKTIWICAKLRLQCIGGIQSASLTFRYSCDECTCTGQSTWGRSFARAFNAPCNPYCPSDFPCNEEWNPYGYSGDPGIVWGGGANNCNRWTGDCSLLPVATLDYGTLIWNSGC